MGRSLTSTALTQLKGVAHPGQRVRVFFPEDALWVTGTVVRSFNGVRGIRDEVRAAARRRARFAAHRLLQAAPFYEVYYDDDAHHYLDMVDADVRLDTVSGLGASRRFPLPLPASPAAARPCAPPACARAHRSAACGHRDRCQRLAGRHALCAGQPQMEQGSGRHAGPP